MIELTHVTMQAGDCVLQDVSFVVPGGKYAVLMGQTGIGKTTVLESICGLKKIRNGKILVGGREVQALPPGQRCIGYTPQDFGLFPTLDVREHLQFAMRLRHASRPQMADRVAELSELLGIGHLLDRSVVNLSGGEAQRVALGRALSFRPSVLLLDEPLSALDEQTRSSAYDMLLKMKAEAGVTVLHVTHSQAEADRLADMCIRLERNPDTQQIEVV
jgi:ABC-type sugar transport system ATPase subunit